MNKKHWFTADLHLGHAFIIKHCDRPFADVEEMDDCILHRINMDVAVKDVLYILGDFCWGANNVARYRDAIRCKEVHLIQGNHDKNSATKHFSTCEQFREIKVTKQRITLCHYPLIVWPGHLRGSWHLYGHGHGTHEETIEKMHPGRRSIDVGIDNAIRLFGGIQPFSFDYLKELFSQEE